jgi:putative sterol carrier protein
VAGNRDGATARKSAARRSRASASADPIREFFDALARRGHDPMLERVSGTIRYDVRSGRGSRHFSVRIERGDLSVSRENAEADCVIRADADTFEGLVRGDVNPLVAMLRADVDVEGDRRLPVLAQRLFPAPRKQHTRKLIRASGGRR